MFRIVIGWVLLLLTATAAGATEIAPSVGPGRGELRDAGPRDGVCPDGTLRLNSDGSYENGVAWQYGGVAAPFYGAFAECFADTGSVCAVVFDLTRMPGQSGGTMDVYVWADAGGEPGTVLSVTTAVDPGAVSLWPEISRHTVDIGDLAVSGPYWVGHWGNWPGAPSQWYLAADTNGPELYCPRTCIAPDAGFPSGWQETSLVWPGIHGLGIGSVVQTLGQFVVSPNATDLGPDPSTGHCGWQFGFGQSGTGPGDIEKVVLTVDTPEVGIIPGMGACSASNVVCTTQSVTWTFPGGLDNAGWQTPTIRFTKLPAGSGLAQVSLTAYNASGGVYNPGPATLQLIDGSLTLCTGGCYPPPPRMTGWIPLDDISVSSPPRTRDLAKHHAFDPVVHQTSAAGNPKVGGARSFSSTADYLEASNARDNPQTGDFTVAAWVRLTAASAFPRRTIVDDSAPSSSPGYSFFVSENSGTDRKLSLELHDAIGGSATWHSTAAQNLNLGAWYHAAVTVDRDGAVHFYLNGAVAGGPFGAGSHPGTLFTPGLMRFGLSEAGGGPLMGDLDEIAMYARALSPAEIHEIYAADASGLCKTLACTPRAVMSDPRLALQHTKTQIWICNYGATAATDDVYWSLLGLPAAGAGNECAIPGPTQISPGFGGPVHPAPCASTGVITMDDPGVSPTQSACYRAKVVNATTGAVTYCDGSMRAPSGVLAAPTPRFASLTEDDGAFVEVPRGGAAEGAFKLVNLTGGPIDFPYRISTGSCCGDSIAASAIALNGLPPGTPVEGLAQIPAHDSVMVAVEISFLDHNPFHFYDVLLSGDLDGIPSELEPMSALLVRSVEGADPADAPDPPLPSTPSRFALRAIAPNPARGGTVVRLAVPGPGRVSVEVFDAAGRAVRALERSVGSEGEIAMPWDGRAASGEPVAAGIYFIRARLEGAEGGVERSSSTVVLLR